MYYIGYDIGGTKCAVSLGSVENDAITLIAKRIFPTVSEKTPYDVLDKMISEMRGLIAEHDLTEKDIARAGISCGGPLDSVRGVVLSPPNLPDWDEIAATAHMESATGIPTRLQNDANACAVAEWKFGAGKGHKNVVFLTFGTGLGAGLILDGKLYSGASDMAGEVGHIRLAADGPVGYNKAGSAEGFCSGGGIARSGIMAVKNALANGETPALYTAAGENFDNITAKLIAELANEGDEFCKSIYESCGKRLGMLLSFIMDMINPEVIILGGVFMRAEHLIRPAMEEVIAAEALPHASRVCRILPAGLGEKIGDYAALSVAYM